MDPITMTAATLVAKWCAEGFAKEAGKSAWAGLQNVYNLVRSKLAAKPEDAEVLQRLEQKPTSQARASELVEILDEVIKLDPAFAEELRKRVNAAAEDRFTASFVTEVRDNAKVGKIMNIGSAHNVYT
jgi:hypothetical protein